jgi:hypothetical protein
MAVSRRNYQIEKNICQDHDKELRGIIILFDKKDLLVFFNTETFRKFTKSQCPFNQKIGMFFKTIHLCNAIEYIIIRFTAFSISFCCLTKKSFTFLSFHEDF